MARARPRLRTTGGRVLGRADRTVTRETRALQEHLDYWAAFWRGLGAASDWRDQDARGRRRPIYELYEVPKRRSWTPDARGARDFRRPRMRQFIREPKRVMRYHLIPPQNDPERLARANGDIISGRNPIMSALDPLGFRFRKVLGQGGGGIAMLVDLLDQNGQTDQWVVKVPLGTTMLGREAANMRLMVGARHIVQRKFIRSSGEIAPADRAILNTDEPDCMYAMELLKYGSLDGLLNKISAQDLKLRDDELWMIFHCLFRACVALSYPGTWSGGLNPEIDAVPLQDEAIPQDVPIETALSMVHFDIDPDNILVGDFESDPGSHTHEVTPIIKIGDLGLGRRMDELERNKDDILEMLFSRRMGKVENHAPEQFTKEWDYLAEPPSRTNEPVAGNYTWKTNLYAVGNVMWQLLTRCCTLLPPNSGDIEFSPDGITPVTGLTYGADLIFSRITDEYDQTLRTTIMWCMMHEPAKRPSLRQLEHLIMGNLRDYQTDGDTNTEGRTSISDILATPPPPSTPSTPSSSSTPSTVVRFAAEAGGAIQSVRSRPVRWSSGGWGAYDGGDDRAGPPGRRTGRGRDAIRAAARNTFRGGGGLRNLARRAGRNIRRVFRGAVRRVTGGHRQTRLGNATVQRPREQQDGRRQTPMAELQRAMASMGFYGAP